MSIAFAGGGAAKALEEIIGEQMLRAQMAQRAQEQAAQLALQTRQVEGVEQDRAANRAAQRDLVTLSQRKFDADQAQDATDRNVGLDASNVMSMPGMDNAAKAQELTSSVLRNPKASSASGMLKTIEGLTRKPAYTPALLVKGATGGEYRQFEEGKIPEGTQIYEAQKGTGSQAKPRVDIRNVQERGPGGEPGTRVLTFNDGNVVSSQWYPGNPTGGERTRIADTESMRTSLDALKGLFKPDYVGPIAGRVGTLGQKIPGVPVDDGQAQFYAATSAVRNAIIKAITGAQMSEPEAKRITSQIPSENDKPEVWNAKYIQSIANVERLDAALSRRQGLGNQAPPDGADDDIDALIESLRKPKG